MRTRLAASAVGVALIGALTIPAASAEAGVTISGPTSITIGTSTLIHYSVTGTADPGDTLGWTLTGRSDCYFDFGEMTADSSGAYRATGSVQPTVDIDDNSCAGAAVLSVESFDQGVTATKQVYLHRAAKWVGVNATPEPIHRGALVTIVGTLERADWADGRYHGFASTVAELQFKSTTGSAYKTYATGSTSAGQLTGHIHQKVSGCWRYVYLGSSTTAATTSGADCVAVVK